MARIRVLDQFFGLISSTEGKPKSFFRMRGTNFFSHWLSLVKKVYFAWLSVLFGGCTVQCTRTRTLFEKSIRKHRETHTMRFWGDRSVFCRTGPPDSRTGPRSLKDLGPVRFLNYTLIFKYGGSASCIYS